MLNYQNPMLFYENLWLYDETISNDSHGLKESNKLTTRWIKL